MTRAGQWCCAPVLLLLAACHQSHSAAAPASSDAAPATASGGNASIPQPVGAPASASSVPLALATPALASALQTPATESAPPTAADAATFAPLQSAQVKDAIYRAMTTAKTQRWKDGALSGYAVPGQALGVYGCRAVSYTVDQLPRAAPKVINACH